MTEDQLTVCGNCDGEGYFGCEGMCVDCGTGCEGTIECEACEGEGVFVAG
ncbi:MAG: hypothetical protein ABIQ02_03545 [Saprospiraceae bacterium]